MATVIRAELSKRNKYWVEKHRYYELKHFCLQYPFWKRAYSEIEVLGGCTYDPMIFHRSSSPGDPTGRLAEKRMLYHDRMKLVEQTALAADSELATYILKGVTEELSFNMLKLKLDIPCSKDTYYDRYRKFFWLLDEIRD